MRAVVQRVSSAAVSVDGAPVSSIDAGMLVFLGVGAGDGECEADRIAEKLLRLRIFEDESGRTNDPLGRRQVLCVSQFTLYADTSRGNRPGFAGAADPETARALYERVCERLGAERGAFGERMTVELSNEGPFTVLVEVAPQA